MSHLITHFRAFCSTYTVESQALYIQEILCIDLALFSREQDRVSGVPPCLHSLSSGSNRYIPFRDHILIRFNIVAFPMVCHTGAFRVVVVLSRLLALEALSKSAAKMITLCREAADRDLSFCIVLLPTLSSSISPPSSFPSLGQGPAQIAHSPFVKRCSLRCLAKLVLIYL